MAQMPESMLTVVPCLRVRIPAGIPNQASLEGRTSATTALIMRRHHICIACAHAWADHTRRSTPPRHQRNGCAVALRQLGPGACMADLGHRYSAWHGIDDRGSARGHLAVDPLVGLLHTLFQPGRAPSPNRGLTSVLSLFRPRTPLGASRLYRRFELHAGDLLDDVHQLVDADQFSLPRLSGSATSLSASAACP